MLTLLLPAQTPAPAAPGVPQAAGPQAPALPALPGVADLASLQGQLVTVNVQLSALRAQYGGLERQLNRMRLDNPARPAVQQQAANVGVQIAQLEGDAARIGAQIAQMQGRSVPGTIQIPVIPRQRQWDPDYTAGLMFAFIFAVLMPMSIGWARRIWKGRPTPPQRALDDTSGQRLERLEHAIDAIAIEVERISEGQRFVTKVLAERPMGTAPASPAAGAASPDARANAGEPLRALGAGPMEPIRVPEGQKVRPSITPH